ncbi:hypothetical protein EYZ11_005833 [Aspergillus tanneri]|uniref:Carrier domain-containing protein n=1 Tax=Aspergillus tanneri TaxID=1220188 RepID=A0A4S3JJG4_9EURO|nr:hypothetical protein EYZ11_005833 [Aspergillus tanneri]
MDELINALEDVIHGSMRPQKVVHGLRMAFVFTGQGAQWARMGQRLLDVYPTYARAISKAEKHLKMLGATWSLESELARTSAESRINEVSISQPCCTAVQLALVDLLREWNIYPQIVCGHSSGEIAAAYAAGFLSSLDALRIAFYRGSILGRLKEQYPHIKGGMLAVGDTLVLEKIRVSLNHDGIFNRPLAVDVAYHSHHMYMVQEEYFDAIKAVQPLKPNGHVRMVSSVTGKVCEWFEMGGSYWVDNLTSPVRFVDAIESALAVSCNIKSDTRHTLDIVLEVLLLRVTKQFSFGIGMQLEVRSEWLDAFSPSDVIFPDMISWEYQAMIATVWSSAYICMVVEALRQTTIRNGRAWKRDQICRFREVFVETALIVSDAGSGIEILLTVRPYIESATELSPDWKEFRAFSLSDTGNATLHCRGLVLSQPAHTSNQVDGGREITFLRDADRKQFAVEGQGHQSFMGREQFYRKLRCIGQEYTPPFDNLFDIRAGKSASFCKFSIPDTRKSMPAEFQQSHVIHPAVLDSCFQLPLASLLCAGKAHSGFVLSSISEITISTNVSSEPGSLLRATATVEPFSRSKPLADVKVGNHDLSNPSLISIKGLCFTSGGKLNTKEANLCSRVNWAPDITCAQPRDIHQLCYARDPEEVLIDQWPLYDRYLDMIIRDTLPLVSPHDEASMAPHFRNLLRWMRSRQSTFPSTAVSSLRDRVQSVQPFGTAVVQVSDHLLDILQGRADALDVLMKNSLLYQFYQADHFQRCHAHLANYVSRLQFKNPSMRILEIGAGTGSATLSVLGALGLGPSGHVGNTVKMDRFFFTDISAGFFEKAKEALAQWGDAIEFKKLDIEHSVKEQGFAEGSFDLVIASNVLHATRRMSNTLQNVRKLLKPGGKLALVEITSPHDFWSLVMGVLPGWWLGIDDGRVDSPLLQLPEWHTLLCENGFSGVDAEMKDYESASHHQISLIVSTVVPETVHVGRIPPIHIVSRHENSSVADNLSNLIKVQAPSCQIQKSYIDNLDPTPHKLYVILLEIITPFLASCTALDFQRLKNLFSEARRILWVTRGAAVEATDPKMAIITGLARSLRSEDKTLEMITLDLDPLARCSPEDMAQHIHSVLEGMYLQPSDEGASLHEHEYAIRNNKILIPRIMEDAPLEEYVRNRSFNNEPQRAELQQFNRSLQLEVGTPGLLETLRWVESPTHSRKPLPNEVRVEMEVFALNFRDIMSAMGQLDARAGMLYEGGGKVVEVGEGAEQEFQIGDRVCVTSTSSLATRSNIDIAFVHHVPEGMSLETANAVQIAYATALYALRDVAHLQKGETILIHSAMGALGQAAIAMARYLGAGDIFVTVGNAHKKSCLIRRFGIPEKYIYSSRAVSFKHGIQRQTKGRGVDVVLNSLSGEATRESLECLANFGRFIEVGKGQLLSNRRMELQSLEGNRIFATVDLLSWADHKPSEMKKLCATVLDLIHTLQTGKHLGKIVLQVDSQSQGLVLPPTPVPCRLKSDCAYLIVGGLGGLGRAIVRHFASLGARNIVVLSRSGVAESAERLLLSQEMHEVGINLMVHQGSVGKLDDVQKVRDITGTMAIRGIVHGAMHLQVNSP